jgi:hypothetical protein
LGPSRAYLGNFPKFGRLCHLWTQIQGHAPQGVREQNYIRRPLDLLRVHHEKIEAWILKEAGVDFDPAKAAPAGLRVVA